MPLAWISRLFPDSAVLLSPGREPLGGAALRESIAALARQMTEAGLKPGDALAMALPDGPELLANAAAAAAVAACAPLNPDLLEAELEAQLRRLAPRALLAPPESAARRAGERLGIPLFEPGRALAPAPDARSYPGAVLLLHTSATTGTPKLVPLSESNLEATFAGTREALQLTEADCFLSMMPLFHLQGLMAALGQFRAGGTVVATAGFDPHGFLDWLEEYRPTWYTAGPTLHRAILALNPGAVCRRCGLRVVRSVGAPLPAALLEEIETALGVTVIEGYGSTEAGLLTSNRLPPGIRKPGSVGLPVSGAEVALDDGEIVARGPSIASGYANDPEGTREAFREGWFHTGDLGWFDPDGYLYVTGRIKDIINRGGEKVQPVEVDRALEAHPAVREAAAFPVPHPTLGEEVAAAVVLQAGASARESELRRFVSARLAAFKVPRRILTVKEIPKGGSGKPLRTRLTAEYAPEASAPQPPSDALEARLAALWAGMLGAEGIGVADDFFSLGGNSLLAANMLVRVEEECGCRVAAFSEPASVEHLAELIRGGFRAAPRPLFAIPGADQNPFSFHPLASRLAPDQPVYVLRAPEAATIPEMARALINEMTAVCPEGPYLVAGHCFGGLVAFEIGCQLERDGVPVGLVLIDTPRPGYPSLPRDWRMFARALFEPDWLVRPSYLFGRLRLRLNGRTPMPDPVAAANTRLAAAYDPCPFGGRLVHFVAADEWQRTLPRLWRLLGSPCGWSELAAGGVDLRPMAAGHSSILAEPAVGEMAAQLRDLIPALIPCRVCLPDAAVSSNA